MLLAYQSLLLYITSFGNKHSAEVDEKPCVHNHASHGHWLYVDSMHTESSGNSPTNFTGYCIRSSEKNH